MPDHDPPTPYPDRDPGSITRLIPALKKGEQHAVSALWERFFAPLAAETARQFPGGRWRSAGPEDVAVDAFLEFCRKVSQPDADQKFPRLHSRDNLWKLLVCFTIRAAFDLNQKERRRAEVLAGESALGEGGFGPFAGREPAPEFTAAIADMLELLRDPGNPADDRMRQIALLRMEGLRVDEIAEKLDCSLSTVERKLSVIRTIWSEAMADGA